MISSETPYKLAEIIRDTWPNLYHQPNKMNEIQKINQVEYSDYYSVFDKNGRKICDTPSFEDAMMMVSLGRERTYKKIRVLSDQVVNVDSIRIDDKQLKEQIILPDRMAEPFIV